MTKVTEGSISHLLNLPVELVEYILDILPVYARFVVLQVCRSLSLPSYWQCAYQSVFIQDDYQLHKFMETINVSSLSNGYSKLDLGHCVKRLSIPAQAVVTDRVVFGLVQQYCPYIEYFDMNLERSDVTKYTWLPSYWRCVRRASGYLFSNFPNLVAQSHKQLTCLVVEQPIDFGRYSFPQLTDLKYYVSLHQLTIQVLNQINRSCPLLRDLSLHDLDFHRSTSSGVDDTDLLDMITGQSLSVSRLYIRRLYLEDPSWYQLFGRLYPLLRSIEIQDLAANSLGMNNNTILNEREGDNIDNNDVDDDDDVTVFFRRLRRQAQRVDYRLIHTWPDLKQCLKEMLNRLGHLRRLHVYRIGASPQPGKWSPNDAWLQNCTRLCDVRLDWYFKSFKSAGNNTKEGYGSKWGRVTHFVESCQETLQSCHLFLKHDAIPLQLKMVDILSACRWLHTLAFHMTYESDVMVPIDILLTTLPQLKTLEIQTKYGKERHSPLDMKTPRVQCEKFTASTQHNLTKLVYIGKIHTTRFLDYIYARCPRLSILHIDGRQTLVKKAITLSFPSWRLQQLDLGSTITAGKMMRTVLVKKLCYNPPRYRSYKFYNGEWTIDRTQRSYQKLHPMHSDDIPPYQLTVICDYLEQCFIRPSPQFLHGD